MSKLRGMFLDTGSALKKLATALGVRWSADNTKRSVALVQNRLIHLLGGDQSDDSSPMRQENETGITDELREYVRTHETAIMVYATMPLQTEEKPTLNGDTLLAIADRIDARVARLTHDAEMWRDRAGEVVKMWRERAYDMKREHDELQGKIADLLDLLRDARDECKMLDRMSAETSANFHAMRDRVWGLEAERDELRGTTAELQDKLDHVVRVCQSYAEAMDA